MRDDMLTCFDMLKVGGGLVNNASLEHPSPSPSAPKQVLYATDIPHNK